LGGGVPEPDALYIYVCMYVCLMFDFENCVVKIMS